MIIRQGDLVLMPVKKSGQYGPETDHILAVGEQSGHNHTLHGARYFRAEDGGVYVRVGKAGALLDVQPPGSGWRHAPIQIPEGTYRVVVERQYSPEAIRQVGD